MSETEKDHASGMSDSAKNDLSESAHQYEVGDIIVYQTFSGDYRRVKVTSKESNIKNGGPASTATSPGTASRRLGLRRPDRPSPERIDMSDQSERRRCGETSSST